MKAIIVGGAGFIGSHTVREFLGNGWEVCVLDSFVQYTNPALDRTHQYMIEWRHDNLLKGSTVARCNTRDAADLRRRITSFNPDVVVTFASLPLANVAMTYTEEAKASILDGTCNILECLRDIKNPPRLVYISSSMVYGDFVKDPMPEDALCSPKEIYGSFKLSGEHVVRSYGRVCDIPYTIIRPSSVYGPTDLNNRVVDIFLKAAIEGTTPDAHNSYRKLDFSFVEDVAKGIYLASTMRNGVGETFNISRGRARTLDELIDVITQKFQSFKPRILNIPDYRPERGSLDTSKAREMLGYNPKVDLEYGVVLCTEALIRARAEC